MKKILVSLVVMLTCIIIFASETPMISISSTSLASSSLHVKIPTGVFFNGYDFVKVESTWVRICIGRQSSEYSIKKVEMDPYGNYVLILPEGESITITSNGKSLYYKGSKYSKK